MIVMDGAMTCKNVMDIQEGVDEDKSNARIVVGRKQESRTASKAM
jgi:hypothetical protein